MSEKTRHPVLEKTKDPETNREWQSEKEIEPERCEEEMGRQRHGC